MKKFFLPNKLSIAIFILFIVFLIVPIIVPTLFGRASWFTPESQKYSNVFRGIGNIFLVWSDISFFSTFGLWFFLVSINAPVGTFKLFSGDWNINVLGVIVILVGPFIYYLLSLYLSSLVEDEAKRKVIIKAAIVLTFAFPVVFAFYTYTVAGQINKLNAAENCTIQCVLPEEQKLQPAIDACRTQCNARFWSSDGQRISCWSHCSDDLDAARARCQTMCKQ
jgi:hypothetical protein